MKTNDVKNKVGFERGDFFSPPPLCVPYTLEFLEICFLHNASKTEEHVVGFLTTPEEKTLWDDLRSFRLKVSVQTENLKAKFFSRTKCKFLSINEVLLWQILYAQ